MRPYYALVVFALALGLTAAQRPSRSYAKDPALKEHAAHDKTMKAEPVTTTGKYTMTARLVDRAKKAAKKEATVEVAVGGIKLTDPASVKEQPRPGQGHLHYQVDDGPVIATTAPKLSFHDLKSGHHRIQATLVANDHSKLGPEQTLEVNIP